MTPLTDEELIVAIMREIKQTVEIYSNTKGTSVVAIMLGITINIAVLCGTAIWILT